MDIKQLEYFAAIAQEGSISAAARKLHISQPPLSQQLRLLEEELGLLLVERGPRRVTLTEGGRLLYERAQAILELADNTARELRDLGSGLSGTLRLGVISSSGAILMRRSMAAFSHAHPRVRFDIREGNTYELVERVLSGMIEVAVVRTPFSTDGLACRPVLEEPMTAVAQPGTWQEDGPMTLAQLAAYPLILYRRFEHIILPAFLREGIDCTILCKNDDARTTLLWAQAGLGVGLAPRSATEIFSPGSLQVRVVDYEGLRTQVTVITKAGGYLSQIARRFVDFFAPEAPGKDAAPESGGV